MAMGYGANFALTLSPKDIQKIIPSEFKKLIEILKANNTTLEELACANALGCYVDSVEIEIGEKIIDTLESLCESFAKKTGIELSLNYHDSENHGDIYDAVDGCYFEMLFSDVYQLTPSAQELEKQGLEINFDFFVTFG